MDGRRVSIGEYATPLANVKLGKKKYKGGMEKGEIRKKMDKEQR